MSFSAEWLALREPVDHASLNPEVKAALAYRFSRYADIDVVDLGAGAGSNLRALYRLLPAEQNWTLVDADAVLLAAARERLRTWAESAEPAGRKGEMLRLTKDGRTLTVAFKQADLATGFVDPIVKGVDLVTAAALFDLVSEPVIARMASTITGNGQVFLATLSYDGAMSWSPPHAADGEVRAAFNRHQAGDKGFGPAAGPESAALLHRAFYGRGYRVLRGTSPWVVTDAAGGLRAALDAGCAAAVGETGLVDRHVLEGWLDLRRAPGGSTVVGHEDLLAMPAK
jgi:SAM-dependent methyltransferase